MGDVVLFPLFIDSGAGGVPGVRADQEFSVGAALDVVLRAVADEDGSQMLRNLRCFVSRTFPTRMLVSRSRSAKSFAIGPPQSWIA